MARFIGKVALITGGARGIGRATAQAFSAEGARVLVADVDAEASEATARALGGGAISLGLDVADPGSVKAVVAPPVQKVLDRLKDVPIDIEPRFVTAQELTGRVPPRPRAPVPPAH